MRRTLLSLSLLATLVSCSSAFAAADPITAVFTQATPISCYTVPDGTGVIAGQRWCSGGNTIANPAATPLSAEPSFDGIPIDTNVILPPKPASGTDGNFPVVVVGHGYGGQKFPPANASDPLSSVQKWVTRGYAVLTVTERGFFGSCGPTSGNPAICSSKPGYIHLMANQWEVRDTQYLLGLLADDGIVSPTKIGATGISYGGGKALLLGALKNRIYNDAGNLVAWTSPNGKPMSIAATTPNFGWSDLAQSLLPNGTTLDYAAANPYRGPSGSTRSVGAQKQYWTGALYAGGAAAGKYCTSPCPDPRYDVTAFKTATDTGGPYSSDTTLNAAVDELSANHGANSTDDSVAPAPALIENGWNDDLFPVDEGVRYYNKIRQKYPDAPVNLWAVDFGHTPRSFAAPNSDVVLSLTLAQLSWMDYYVRGIGGAPEDANGGVNTIASACTDQTSGSTAAASQLVHARNWASLSQGELVLNDAASKTVAATNTFGSPFETNTTSVCNTQAGDATVGAQTYTLPAQSKAITIAGSTTIKADTAVTNENDQLVARLYDLDPAANTERLIGRGVLRPGAGTKTQVFQIHPQEWVVAVGHRIRLELATQDPPYVRNATGQAPITVSNLTVRVPTLNAPGEADVTAPADKPLPAGYSLARDFVKVTATPTVVVTTTTTPEVTPTVTVTATPTYTVPSGKKSAGLTGKVRPKRDRNKPFKFAVRGRVKRPAGVSRSAGCKGNVKVTVRKGSKVVARRTVGVRFRCKYVARVKLGPKAGAKGKAKFTISFGGNAKLKKKTIKRSAHFGTK